MNLSRGLVGLLCLFAGSLFGAFAGAGAVTAVRLLFVPAEVTAQKFVLVDAAGNVRALLCLTDAGPGLVLFDDAGKPRASLP